MTTPRTAVRTAAVLGATAALTFAGAGAASATTAVSAVDVSTVSVTFTLENGESGDACGAILAPTSKIAELTTAFTNADTAGGLQNLLATLTTNDSIIVLTDSTNAPAVMLAKDTAPTGAVSATNVPANLYALVSMCVQDDKPTINPTLFVGNPVEALTGSLSGLGGGDALGMMSSAIGGADGDTDGDTGGDMGAALGSLAGLMGGAAE